MYYVTGFVLVPGGAYHIHAPLLECLQQYLSEHLHNVTIQGQQGLPPHNALLLLVPPVDGWWRDEEDDESFRELMAQYPLVVLRPECCADVPDKVCVSLPFVYCTRSRDLFFVEIDHFHDA